MPATVPTIMPSGMPSHGVMSYLTSAIVTVYAPSPKNAAWPNEMRPV
jgi:hypothetical protein